MVQMERMAVTTKEVMGELARQPPAVAANVVGLVEEADHLCVDEVHQTEVEAVL